VFPTPLRLVATTLLPLTYGMDLLRHYVMGTHTILSAPYEWGALAAQLLGLGLLARWSVGWLERTARDQGLHYL
jgi:hypothetical protein